MEKSVNAIWRVLSAVFSVFAIIAIMGEWLAPLTTVFGFSYGDGYTLFQISDMMSNINKYVEKEELAIFAVVFSAGSVVTIILFAATAILNLLGGNTKALAGLAATCGILISGLFLFIVFFVNTQLQQFTGTERDAIQATLNPYLLIIFSALANIFSRSDKKTTVNRPVLPTTSRAPARFCAKCGTALPVGATFCPRCGNRIGGSVLSDVAKEEAERRSAERTLRNNGWICRSCGRVNQQYTGTCACGNIKPNR